jgi:Ser/Thr protein kinase RdoA (MazF antagonist)
VEQEGVVFDYLERHAFPAPRLLRTLNHEIFVQIEDRRAIALTYIDGGVPEPTLGNHFKAGQLMAELHSIDEEFPYESEFVFKKEIPEMLKRAEKAESFPEYVDVVNSLPDFSGLPEGLIHTDLGPGGNTIMTPDGKLVPIDWDGAGRGPLLIDLGGPFGNLFGHDDLDSRFGSGTRPYEIDDLMAKKDKVEAFYKGYLSRRKINDRERDLIFDCGLVWDLSYCIIGWKDYKINRAMWNRVRFALENEQLIRSIVREWIS